MAIVFATKTGNWSDTTLWNTGALPTASDDVYANGFTVTINQNITVLSIRNTNTTGVTGVGSFNINISGLILNCDIYASTITCLGISNTSVTCTINGNSYGGTVSAAHAINSACLNLTFNGTLNSNTSGQGHGLLVTSGNVVLTGNVYSLGGNNAFGLQNNGNGTVTITGNVGTLTSSNGGGGVNNTTSGTIIINGNATGGPTLNNNYGALNSGASGTIIINGSAIGNGGAGAANSSSGIIRVTRAIGSQGTTNGTGVTNSLITGTVVIKEAEFGPLGQCPFSGYVEFDNNVSPIIQVRRENNTNITLTDPINTNNLLPTTNNVRAGIQYNNKSLTGTLVVPSSEDVRKNIPVDNTVGQSDLTASDVIPQITDTIANQLLALF